MLIEEILKGESEKIEFKENAKTNTYIKTVVAFANGNGGKIVFGVKDNKEIVGVENEFEVMDGIINAISDSCYPMIVPDISLHTLENKTIILVEIEGGKKKPYYLKSKGMQKGTYIRSGATTRIIEEDYVLKELVLEGKINILISKFAMEKVLAMKKLKSFVNGWRNWQGKILKMIQK